MSHFPVTEMAQFKRNENLNKGCYLKLGEELEVFFKKNLLLLTKTKNTCSMLIAADVLLLVDCISLLLLCSVACEAHLDTCLSMKGEWIQRTPLYRVWIR